VTVLDDIAEVRDGELTRAEKRTIIRRLRAEEWERLQSALPVERTFTALVRGVSRSITVTVTAITRSQGVVTLEGSDSRGLISWPIRVVNPPLLYPDPAGMIALDEQARPRRAVDGDVARFRLDAGAVLRDVIRDAAIQAAR